jgi:hypothetical protein
VRPETEDGRSRMEDGKSESILDPFQKGETVRLGEHFRERYGHEL